MRTALTIMLLLTFSETTTQAQTRLIERGRILLESRPSEIGLKQVGPIELDTAARLADDDPPPHQGKNESSSNLPETPTPKSPTEKDSPCPNGIGKPCAALGGHLYFVAPFHMDEPDKTWCQAMSHPLMWTTSALLIGLTVKQLVETDRCINANKPACNLVFRKNRAATYAVNIPLTAAMIWHAGKLKQSGHGSKALVWIGLNLMYQEAVSGTANPRVLTCQAGRTPQCQ